METGKIKKQWAVSANRVLQLVEEKQDRLQKEAAGQNRKWLIRELDTDVESLISFYNETEEIIEALLTTIHEQKALWNIQQVCTTHFENRCAQMLFLATKNKVQLETELEGATDLLAKKVLENQRAYLDCVQDAYMQPTDKLFAN